MMGKIMRHMAYALLKHMFRPKREKVHNKKYDSGSFYRYFDLSGWRSIMNKLHCPQCGKMQFIQAIEKGGLEKNVGDATHLLHLNEIIMVLQ